MDDTATFEKGELIATINSINSAQELTVITLPMVQKATEEDGVLVKQMIRGHVAQVSSPGEDVLPEPFCPPLRRQIVLP